MAIQRRARAAQAGESPRAKHYRYGVKWLLGGDGAPQSLMLGTTKGHEAQAVSLNAWIKSQGWNVTAAEALAHLSDTAPSTPDEPADDEPAPTVREVVETWIYDRPGRTESTRRTYRATLKNLETLGDVRADAVTRAQVNAWFSWRERGGAKAKTLQVSRIVLRGSLRPYLGARLGDVFGDVSGYGRAQRVVSPAVLTDAQIADLLAHADVEGIRLEILTAATLGLRWGELVGLRARDVDLDRGVVRVERQVLQAAKREDGFQPAKLKTTRSRREIPMPASLVDALALVRELDDDAPVFAPRYGSFWCYDGFTKAWARTRAATPSVADSTRFHDLRGSAAVRWLTASKPVPLGTVSKWLGHSDVRVTDQAYGQIVGAAEHNYMKTAGLQLA